jgi:hypothetical protein
MKIGCNRSIEDFTSTSQKNLKREIIMKIGAVVIFFLA